MKKNRTKRIFSLVGNIFVLFLIASCIFVLIIAIMSKKDTDGAATMFGYQLRFIQSSSMEQCEQTDVSGFDIKHIPIKSCVFVKVIPQDEQQKAEWVSNLKVGDVLTFRYTYAKQETITHRIIRITKKVTGGYVVELAADNRIAGENTPVQKIDTSLSMSPNFIIGKVTGQSYVLGLIVYALKSPVGLVCIIIIPCLIIIALQVIKIAGLYKKEKNSNSNATQDKQSREIEELRRELQLLQNIRSADAGRQASYCEKNTNAPTEPLPNENNTGQKTDANISPSAQCAAEQAEEIIK